MTTGIIKVTLHQQFSFFKRTTSWPSRTLFLQNGTPRNLQAQNRLDWKKNFPDKKQRPLSWINSPNGVRAKRRVISRQESVSFDFILKRLLSENFSRQKKQRTFSFHILDYRVRLETIRITCVDEMVLIFGSVKKQTTRFEFVEFNQALFVLI